ncbi:hypothetical protein Bca4012_066566 [Brassica carinata]
MTASPCVLQPPCLALLPPHNNHCDHGLSFYLHHQGSSASPSFLPLPELNKNQIQNRERDRDRRRLVEPWWSGGETTSVRSNGGEEDSSKERYTTHSILHPCTKIKATYFSILSQMIMLSYSE